jgi:hypothetical protein
MPLDERLADEGFVKCGRIAEVTGENLYTFSPGWEVSKGGIGVVSVISGFKEISYY